MIRLYFLPFFLLGVCSGAIFRFTDKEYHSIPPVFHLDPYEKCMHEPGAIYCTADFTLVSDTPSPMLQMIQEYSEYRLRHFNHTKLTYGLCVTNTCKKYYENTTADLELILEACLNESMWNNYQLKTKISNAVFCNNGEEPMEIDTADISVAVIFGTIVMIIVVGSFYDFCFTSGNDGINALLCFAIRRNWRKLTAPAANGPDQRLKRLVGIHGIKTLAACLVIMAHSMMACVYCVDNPWFLESLYDTWLYHIPFNGSPMVQAFLVISAFLLAYHIQIQAEKQEITWMILSKAILLRWLRLTPPYLAVLAYISTLHRYSGSGPLWKKVVVAEATDCRHEWWLNLLYLNNQIDATNCMIHTWYLAVDTQLFILGIIICVACRTGKARTVVLSILLLIGMVIPAAITIYLDLDDGLKGTPEGNRDLFVKDPIYIHVYRRGYTNMASYAIGLALGYLVYYGQKQGFDVQKYKKYRLFYYLLLPLGFGVILIGKVYFDEGPRASVYLRAASAACLKPVFGLIIAIYIAANVFKYEDIYRDFVEWNGWTTFSRLSYSAYLLHFSFIRYIIGSQVTLTHSSSLMTVLLVFGIICMSFLFATVFWVAIEAPSGELVKLCLGQRAADSERTELTNGKQHQNGKKYQ